MKNRGIVESIDIIISFIALMVAIGYTYRVAEANYYALKQDEILSELRVFGSSAAELLVTSPETVCKCTVNAGTGDDFYVMNCIDTAKMSGLTPEKLNLSSGRFSVRVEIRGNATPYPGAPELVFGSDLPTDNRPIYSESRVVITNSGNITKEKLVKCMKGEQNCERKIATIYIWRRD